MRIFIDVSGRPRFDAKLGAAQYWTRAREEVFEPAMAQGLDLLDLMLPRLLLGDELQRHGPFKMPVLS